MHRPLALLTAVLVLALLGGSASGRGVRRLAPVGQNAVFVVTGHGWGHGVGMSQYGAYGYAQHGFPYTKIVVHSFPGTTLGPAPVSKVGVLVPTRVARVGRVWPLSRHAWRGVCRRRARETFDGRCRGRDGREGRPLRGHGREDVFLFGVWWTHRGRAGCLGRDCSLSRFGA